MKIAIYGIGVYGQWFRHYCEISDNYEIVVAFDSKVIGKTKWEGIELVPVKEVNSYRFDKIVITPNSDTMIEEMEQELKELMVASEKIVVLKKTDEILDGMMFVSRYRPCDVRVSWLRDFARLVRENEKCGAVAECGVNRGDFSMYINEYFFDKKLYLFDTFDGFAEQDLKFERKMGDDRFLNGPFNSNTKFRMTNEEWVLKRMPFKENCEIRKGYFPDTAEGLEREKFCFVNLDMDLYRPQIEGLRFFYDKMVKGGVILLHDYFKKTLPGVKQAVNDFVKERNNAITIVAVGDGCSIAIIK